MQLAMWRRVTRLVLLTVVAGSWTSAAFGAGKSRPTKKTEEPVETPVDIRADRIEFSGQRFLFTGHVVVIQNRMEVRCEKLEGELEENQKTLKNAVATGKVKITKGSVITYGHRALFDFKANVVTLLPKPGELARFEDDHRSGEAKKIIYNLTTDRTVMEGVARVRLRVKPVKPTPSTSR